MLRTLFLLFVLANVLVLAWRSTWLSPWLPVPSERKPEILAQQLHADRVRWPGDPKASAPQAASAASSGASAGASSGESSGASAASGLAPSGSTPAAPASSTVTAPTGTASAPAAKASQASAASGAATVAAASTPRPGNLCLQGPWLDKEETAGFEKVLTQLLQKGQWQTLNQQSGGSYHIYMGKYASQEQLERKEQELKRLGVNFEALRNSPGLEPGLSLGKYAREDQAERALDALERKGIRTAKVITITPAQVQWSFKMQGLSPDQAQQLKQRLGERNLRVCGSPARA